MEEKISSQELQKNLPETGEVSDPDSVSESVVTTVSGNDAILVPGAAVAAYSNELFRYMIPMRNLWSPLFMLPVMKMSY